LRGKREVIGTGGGPAGELGIYQMRRVRRQADRPLGNRGVVLIHCDKLKVEDSRLLHFISESEIGNQEPMPYDSRAAAGAC
jgi:hypothetical protein